MCCVVFFGAVAVGVVVVEVVLSLLVLVEIGLMVLYGVCELVDDLFVG